MTRRSSLLIRYTRLAITDLEQAHAYISRENPAAAAAVANRVRTAIDSLRHIPRAADRDAYQAHVNSSFRALRSLSLTA